MDRLRSPRTAAGWAGIVASGAVVASVLLAVGGRYGLHRDEWYFVEAGHHPAVSYPDQPGLAPIAARLWFDAVGGQVWAFRVAPAVFAVLVVVLAAWICRELDGDRHAQAVTEAATATCSTLLAAGHLFSTTIVDIAVTTATVGMLIRAVRTEDARDWLAWGALLGVALNVKLLPAVVLPCCLLALVLVGPRRWLRSAWPWLGGLLAVAAATPVLWWQASHGWPQLAMAHAIAGGGSGTSTDRWLVLPLQVTTTGPLAFWILVVGIVAGRRQPAHRWLVVAAGLLLVVVVATGGKPYYTMGMVPALLALAGPAVADWLRRSRNRLRVLAVLLVGNLVGGALVTLPLLPTSAVGLLRPVSYDLAEQIGWAHLVDTVESAQRTAGIDRASTVIITSNYGEAGALAAARRAGRDLVPVYSGHNAFGLWGPPPATITTVLWVGPAGDPTRDHALGGTCRTLAPLGTAGVDNDESDAVLSRCDVTGAATWPTRWQQLVHLG